MPSSETYKDVLSSSSNKDGELSNSKYSQQPSRNEEKEQKEQWSQSSSSITSSSRASFLNAKNTNPQQSSSLSSTEGITADDTTDINPATIAEWRRIFAFFDPHALGLIQSSDLGYVLRALSYNPCESDINNLLNSTDHDGSGLLSFSTFCTILISAAKVLPRAPTQEQILSSFEPFDMYRTGKIKAKDFVHLLSNYGEPLTQEDIMGLITEMQIDGDHDIDITQFITHMIQTSTVITDSNNNNNNTIITGTDEA